MHFRIGINLGGVIEDEARIFGDGVKIAARLEGLADAGGICVSGTVYDQVKKKLPYQYAFQGIQTVKNIREPIRVYKILIDSDDKDASDSASLGIEAKWDEIKHLTPLRTKLCVPQLRSNWILRSRLDRRMDEGFARKLTLITASFCTQTIACHFTNQRSAAECGPGHFQGPSSYPQLCWWSLIWPLFSNLNGFFSSVFVAQGLDLSLSR